MRDALSDSASTAHDHGDLIHRLAGGKMVEDWEWQDLLGFMRQLGLVSLPK